MLYSRKCKNDGTVARSKMKNSQHSLCHAWAYREEASDLVSAKQQVPSAKGLDTNMARVCRKNLADQAHNLGLHVSSVNVGVQTLKVVSVQHGLGS